MAVEVGVRAGNLHDGGTDPDPCGPRQYPGSRRQRIGAIGFRSPYGVKTEPFCFQDLIHGQLEFTLRVADNDTKFHGVTLILGIVQQDSGLER